MCCARKYRPRLSKRKEQLHKPVPRELQGRDSFNLGKERIGKVRGLCIDLAYDTNVATGIRCARTAYNDMLVALEIYRTTKQLISTDLGILRKHGFVVPSFHRLVPRP